jgi:chromosome segregation ATPase
MSYDEHQAMWPQMIAALAAIDAALGIPDDGCNSTAQTLEKIRRLRAVEDKANSYIADNARLAEQVGNLRAALDQKQAEYEDLQRHGNNTAHNLARMQAALAENGSRSADYLRKAIKWEARAAELATDAMRYRILRNCNMDVRNRLEHYGGDALDERLDALNSLALGPNVGGNRQ